MPLDALTEVRTHLLRNAGASSGFVLALASMLQRSDEESRSVSLPLLWISDTVSSMEAGRP